MHGNVGRGRGGGLDVLPAEDLCCSESGENSESGKSWRERLFGIRRRTTRRGEEAAGGRTSPLHSGVPRAAATAASAAKPTTAAQVSSDSEEEEEDNPGGKLHAPAMASSVPLPAGARSLWRPAAGNIRQHANIDPVATVRQSFKLALEELTGYVRFA